MKIAPLIIAACLALVAPCLKAMDVEIIETNITVSLKYHIGQAPVPKGSKTTETYQVFAVKNAEIIKFIGQKLLRTFTPKARLVHRESYSMFGIEDYGIYIEDNGVFYDVSSTFHDDNYPNQTAFKTVFNDNTELGISTTLCRSRFNLVMAGTVSNITRGMALDGPAKLVEKIVRPKGRPNWMGVPLINNSFTLQGDGRDINSRNGFVSGTIKYTGSKILK